MRTVVEEGAGRLHPVAHLTFRDPDWLGRQLQDLDGAGVRLAMIAPAAVDGRPLSHPDFDELWDAFVDHGVTPVFHVADQPRVLDDAFYPDDDSFVPVIESVFLWAPPAIALTDLIVNGTLTATPTCTSASSSCPPSGSRCTCSCSTGAGTSPPR